MSPQFLRRHILIVLLIVSLLASFGLNLVLAEEAEVGTFASSPYSFSPVFLPYIRHDAPPAPTNAFSEMMTVQQPRPHMNGGGR